VFNTVLYIAGLGAAVWLAIVAVDTIVAIFRREWRFRLRDLLVFMAVTSVLLAAMSAAMRNTW